MTAVRPIRLNPREEASSFGGYRIERVLGRSSHTREPISAVVDLDGDRIPEDPCSNPHAAYLDATSQSPIVTSEGTTAIHILWALPNARTDVFAGVDPFSQRELLSFEIQPGDTVAVPSGIPFQVGAGILAFIFGSQPPQETPEAADWSLTPVSHAPTHGLHMFQGYNRRTICAAHEDILLERWKITQPLTLALDPGRWHYLTNLVTPIALGWPGGSDLLDRTHSRLLPPRMTAITLIPDGLGYVLIGYVPDLVRDVVEPLLGAGYDRSAIASLGVPHQLLDQDESGSITSIRSTRFGNIQRDPLS